MTLNEIHQRVATLADTLQEHYEAIAMGLPKDNEGFLQVKGDLGDAMKALDHATSVLSRLAFRIKNPSLK